MEYHIKDGPTRNLRRFKKDPEPPFVGKIKISFWVRFKEFLIHVFTLLLRTYKDAKEGMRDKNKEVVDWVKRVIDLIVTIFRR